jgi:hypothetical protein
MADLLGLRDLKTDFVTKIITAGLSALHKRREKCVNKTKEQQKKEGNEGK